MTSEYLIHPIPLMSVSTDMPKLTHLQNYGQKVDLTVYVWYIEGGSKKVCVDAGPNAEILAERGFPGAKTIQSLEEGLGKWGVRPDDIDIVILTHLHHDHIALAPKFQNATFIVQKVELEEAPKWNEFPLFKGSYPEDLIGAINNMETVEGDTNIMDGIDVLLTAGHTTGTQSVSVETGKGKAIIYGACSCLANFRPDVALIKRGMTVIPPAIHLDLVETYKSQARVNEMADIIIPIHEPSFINVDTIPS